MKGKVRQAVIMAGGEGTRLKPLTPVLGRPCIEYTIRSMVSAGVEEVILALGYRSQDIKEALGDGKGLGVELIYSYEDVPMGTAGSVKLLQDRLDETFLIGSGDTLTDADLDDLVDFHFKSGAEATMSLTQVDHPEQFGIVGTDENGRITRFKEKPRTEEVFSNVINAGTYVLQRDVLDLVPKNHKWDFSKNLYMDMLAQGRKLYASTLKGYWKDIGRPSDLLEANLRMADKVGEPTYVPGAITEGNMVVGEVACSGAAITGPAYVGSGSRLSTGSEAISSCLGKDIVLEAEAVVEKCLLLDGCVIGKGTALRNTILGKGCKVAAGMVIRDTVAGDGVIFE
ncbi:MAG: Bifunctional protein GlmU [Methanomassiliicoccales archaeon PtaU1.Bin124]|nr:MAG: Bifunctional protein GlmU [Methanomassiliicoccales archaeon PtaU1.Bin124]